jgi:hypothetical protein
MGMFDTVYILNDVNGQFKCARGHSQVTSLNSKNANGFQTKNFECMMDNLYLFNNKFYVKDSDFSLFEGDYGPKMLQPAVDNDVLTIPFEYKAQMVKRTHTVCMYGKCYQCDPVFYRVQQTKTLCGKEVDKEYPELEFEVEIFRGEILDVKAIIDETNEDVKVRVSNYAGFEKFISKEEFMSQARWNERFDL